MLGWCGAGVALVWRWCGAGVVALRPRASALAPLDRANFTGLVLGWLAGWDTGRIIKN